jgi:uroporphyrin-III C-methyltransferase/precorrin-2 dehydrogenase/sirohydrochlorin ferrochelatase
MRYYPIFLDLQRRPVLLVGAGDVAWRKAQLLRRAGAELRVVALDVLPAFEALAGDRQITLARRAFDADDLADAAFAIAATDDPEVNAAVAAAARARNIPVNVVDAPALCSAILPAVVDRDPVLVAIGTEGSAPVLARRLRERIEALLDPSLGALATLCARWRERVRARLPSIPQRRAFWERAVDGAPAAALRAGRDGDADRAMASLLGGGSRSAAALGEVCLVGAGPGDPGLLTLHALRAIQDADVVFYDALVSAQVLELVRRDALTIAVGKRGGGHSVAQPAIHQQLLDAARRGQRVVRLKGGDPLTFARGGEELQFLRANGIRYRVIPGVTAAAACAAYAGIPLTHRDHAQSLQLVTAHCVESLDRLDWRALAAPRQTLAVYMGVAVAAGVVARLLAAGAAPSTPVAIVENGSRPEQRVILCRLDDLVARIDSEQVRAPAMLLIGSVAGLARELHWFGVAPIDALESTLPLAAAA